MEFSDILTYLDQMIGLKLQPINSANDPLVILDIDHKKQRYTLDKTSSTKKRTRSFSELEKIWRAIEQSGYASVDQALNGSGSSRHQPETIYANLPFIEHFKYDKKKHLYLKDEPTHELGKLKELSTLEARNVRRKIDNSRDFDISQFYVLHREQSALLEKKLQNIFTKYPGESDVDSVRDALEKIKELEIKLTESIVNIDLVELEKVSNDDEDDAISIGTEIIDSEDDEPFNIESDNANENKGIISTRITQVSPTVSLLYDRVLHQEIDLTPEYQRKDRIWPLKDRARLIESILLGFPLPVFYFAERATKEPNADVDFDWVVIDGLQRITTLIDFMKGEFALKELTQLEKYNTCQFKNLPRKEQRKIREYQINGHLIQISNDSEEMIRELFHRINTYGKNLSYQEIRSALYPGSSSRFCKYFANEDAFINGIPAKVSGDRMLDVEYVLRAVSYLVLGYEQYIYKTNDEFLCQCMKVLNKRTYDPEMPISSSDQIFIDIDYRLRASLTTLANIFGADAYKKNQGGRLNKVLFELLVSSFAMMTDSQRALVSELSHASAIKQKLWDYIENDVSVIRWESSVYEEQKRGFDYAISNSTGKRVTVIYRFKSVESMLNAIPNMNFIAKGLLENENKNENKKER